MEPCSYWYDEIGDMSQFGDFFEPLMIRWLNETFKPPQMCVYSVTIKMDGKTSKWVMQ